MSTRRARACRCSISPRSGRLTASDPNNPVARDQRTRELDRHALSQIRDSVRFREILDEANHSNASFYPVDPRGLPTEVCRFSDDLDDVIVGVRYDIGSHSHRLRRDANGWDDSHRQPLSRPNGHCENHEQRDEQPATHRQIFPSCSRGLTLCGRIGPASRIHRNERRLAFSKGRVQACARPISRNSG